MPKHLNFRYSQPPCGSFGSFFVHIHQTLCIHVEIFDSASVRKTKMIGFLSFEKESTCCSLTFISEFVFLLLCIECLKEICQMQLLIKQKQWSFESVPRVGSQLGLCTISKNLIEWFKVTSIPVIQNHLSWCCHLQNID